MQLRPINETDLPFLLSLYASSRAAELAVTNWSQDQKNIFLNSQFQLQHNYYQQQHPKAYFQVIEKNGNPIGRLYYGWEENNIRLIDITLLPTNQGQGIGNQLMRELMDLAASKNGKLSLHVDITNRARNWYVKLGFIPIGNELVGGIYQKMEWNSAS